MKSLENINYKPGGGDKKALVNQKLYWRAEAKVNSKENIGHKPGGGEVKVINSTNLYLS